MIIIYLFILVLNKVEYLEEIMERFVKIGVSGGTVIDSTGMAEAMLSDEKKIPVVGGLRSIFEYCRPHNKTVFSIIEDEDKLKKAKDVITGEVCDVRDPGVGVSFTLPIFVENVLGVPPKTKDEMDFKNEYNDGSKSKDN